jgi:hypothetical protein
MNIWTRERNLIKERDELVESLVRLSHGMQNYLNEDHWGLAASLAMTIHVEATRLEQVSHELYQVEDIIDTLKRIDERFEALEEQINVSDN